MACCGFPAREALTSQPPLCSPPTRCFARQQLPLRCHDDGNTSRHPRCALGVNSQPTGTWPTSRRTSVCGWSVQRTENRCVASSPSGREKPPTQSHRGAGPAQRPDGEGRLSVSPPLPRGPGRGWRLHSHADRPVLTGHGQISKKGCSSNGVFFLRFQGTSQWLMRGRCHFTCRLTPTHPVLTHNQGASLPRRRSHGRGSLHHAPEVGL